jgi:hypothetical protein
MQASIQTYLEDVMNRNNYVGRHRPATERAVITAGSKRNQIQALFQLLEIRIEDAKQHDSARYWELLSTMKQLADRGCLAARKYLRQIDYVDSPQTNSYRSNLARLEDGSPSTSFKGARHQLLTDPNCNHRTYLSSGTGVIGWNTIPGDHDT